ncbi:MAG: hypothetical protein OXE48_07610 [Gammaproteobacteria bacterium]|nr:hypothetical protein [Gammaproteobacteria bacterium]
MPCSLAPSDRNRIDTARWFAPERIGGQTENSADDSLLRHDAIL